MLGLLNNSFRHTLYYTNYTLLQEIPRRTSGLTPGLRTICKIMNSREIFRVSNITADLRKKNIAWKKFVVCVFGEKRAVFSLDSRRLRQIQGLMERNHPQKFLKEAWTPQMAEQRCFSALPRGRSVVVSIHVPTTLPDPKIRLGRCPSATVSLNCVHTTSLLHSCIPSLYCLSSPSTCIG